MTNRVTALVYTQVRLVMYFSKKHMFNLIKQLLDFLRQKRFG